jgi:hypothetical protein
MFRRYANIPISTRYIIGAKFLVTLVSATFMLILNIYLRKIGLNDVQIGGIVAFQYAGGLVLSLPEGLYLRGRRLKPFLLAGALLVPVFAWVVLLCFRNGWHETGAWVMLGLSMALLQLDSFTLPFIVRSRHPESEPEAISLAYAAHSAATLLGGFLILLLGWTGWAGDGQGELEYWALNLVVVLSLPAAFLVALAREEHPETGTKVTMANWRGILLGYDWNRLFRALIPSFLLAIGAGLTIPFINLFFNSVFHLDSDTLAVLGMATSALVFLTALLVPAIRRRHGYFIAITLVQAVAVLMLLGLALTELFSDIPGMVALAVFFFMMRTPLMNMAGPMSNELVMNYVGRRNQDLAGALHASIWSGSWFVSAALFRSFRSEGFPYYQIFLLTVGLYMLAVFLYFLLIRAYNRQGPID